MAIPSQVKWPLRMATVLVVVGLTDGLVVGFAPRPLLWAVLIPALIPVLTGIFVIRPMLRGPKR
jgi:hypothetical protein